MEERANGEKHQILRLDMNENECRDEDQLEKMMGTKELNLVFVENEKEQNENTSLNPESSENEPLKDPFKVVEEGHINTNTHSSSSSSSSEDDESSSSSSDSEDNIPTSLPSQQEASVAEQWFTSSSSSSSSISLPSDPILITSQPEDDDIFTRPHSPRQLSLVSKKRPRPSSPDSDSYVEVDIEQNPPRLPQEETTSDSDLEESESDAQRIPHIRTTSIPSEYQIFEKINQEDANFPILKGIFKMKEATQRAWFTGQWAFTESDLQAKRSSPFEYSSIYIHPWISTAQPYSGSYGGFFVLKQFNGTKLRIKEDCIEFQFIPSLDHTYEVIGRGQNRFGRFLVRGIYTKTNQQMKLRRRYLE